MPDDRIIDSIDRQILTILQGNARVPNTGVARKVGLAPSAVLGRIRRLEAQGLIRGYSARVDPRPMGWGLLAFVFVRTEDRDAGSRTAQRLAAIPEVQEVHNVAGEDCYLVKVRVENPEALGRLLREKIGAILAVRSTRSTVVLETVKESIAVPIAPEPTGTASRRAGKGKRP